MPYLDNDKRYLVFYGGAGSGKSFFIVERYIYKLLKAKRFNLLVVRNTGKSNRDSTFALFKQVIIAIAVHKRAQPFKNLSFNPINITLAG